ncbi:MAG: HipA domain-containing protein [Stagnimonas sp.]|nr:HipA domain-containing protein [Stagnimonas sp.]
MSSYPVISVLANEIDQDEQLGSKTKFWIRRGEDRWLFKEARPNTGEDWAEKVASEIAKRLNINTAQVELAEFAGKRGCLCQSFLNRDKSWTLIHGNEVLAKLGVYDGSKKKRQADHTFANIAKSLAHLKPFPEDAVRDYVLPLLASYVVFDALISNTDRHHENWGLLWSEAATDALHIELDVAPTFDHASSLGRELTEAACETNLARKDAIPTYIRRGRGGIYLDASDQHGANPLALVEASAVQYPAYFMPTLSRLRDIPLVDLLQPLDLIPDGLIGNANRIFAKAMLSYSHTALSKLAP